MPTFTIKAGKTARKIKISKDDLALLKRLSRSGAIFSFWRAKTPRLSISLHSLIVGPVERGNEIDHVNGDRLDLRRSNLRVATRSQNMRNRVRSRNNTSGFKGVSWHRRSQKWVAYLSIEGHRMNLGSFSSKRAAAFAYDAAARMHHGQFGTFNFPRRGERSARGDER